MSDLLQYLILGAILAWAAFTVYRKLFKAKGCGCGCDCSAPSAPGGPSCCSGGADGRPAGPPCGCNGKS
jgi:hypothetical protein